jgi:NAD(P)-dependent dehydrogenase (short-subunit alcohol dehydrogenase family)
LQLFLEQLYGAVNYHSIRRILVVYIAAIGRRGTMARLSGKIALVTGAGRGIGRAEALLLAREGASVIVNDLPALSEDATTPETPADIVAAEIRALGGTAVADHADVARHDEARRLIESAVDRFGRLDILVNNAGIAHAKRIDETEADDWNRVLGVNLDATYALIRWAAPVFKAQRAGVVINTSSPSGFGQYANAAYCAAKEGVVGLTRAVARDLGQFGVRCNCIRPIASGSSMTTPAMIEAVHTSQVELGIAAGWNRWVGESYPDVRPENVAALVVWLCTDACREVNGREFFIAGEEAGLLPEPELIRASFHAGGWTLEAFDDPAVARYLVGDCRNSFRGPITAPSARRVPGG